MKSANVADIDTHMGLPLAGDDGCRLSVDLYRPVGDKPLPVLVHRTCYDNNRPFASLGPVPHQRYRWLASHGFTVAACDVRGTGDSAGEFVPFVNELADGVATLRFLASHPWSNGVAHVFGTGYSAYCATVLAREPEVSVQSAFITDLLVPPSPDAPLPMFWLLFAYLTHARVAPVLSLAPFEAALASRNPAAMDEILGVRMPFWQSLLRPTPLSAQPANRSAGKTPSVFVTGWYSPHLAATVDAFGDLDHGHRHLLVGPWDHDGVRTGKPPTEIAHPGAGAHVDPDELMISWLDRFDTETGSLSRAFVTGLNRWEPLSFGAAETVQHCLQLTSGGAANTAGGDGMLSCESRPQPVSTDRFLADPNHPVPWTSADLREIDTFGTTPRATIDLYEPECCDDVLVYTSVPVEEPLIVAGEVTAALLVDADADSDLFLFLGDVDATGTSTVVSTATTRLHISTAAATTIALTTVRFPLIRHAFLRGHRIRLSISASMYPAFTPRAQRSAPITLSVQHGGAHPSTLTVTALDQPTTVQLLRKKDSVWP